MKTLNVRKQITRLTFCAALTISALAAGARLFAQAPQAARDAPAENAALQAFRAAGNVAYEISPTDTDERIQRYTQNNIAMFKHGVAPKATLLVFFSGTGGTPMSGWPFMEAGANAGYRVIGLQYDNGLSVPQTCGKNPDVTCSDRFREKRIFGDGVSNEIDDLPAESVVNRLTKLLQYLDAHHHKEGWGQYMRNREIDWERIVVSGHSQGGGVAAYIAKKEVVARVIVLSGAWDRVEDIKQLAPWVTSKSVTAADRWYGAYHEKESKADAMKIAYAAIGIPPTHIRVLTLPPNPENKMDPKSDVYHVSMVAAEVTPRDANGNFAYASDWAFMLGRAAK
jgi:predicted esterase